MGQMKHLKEARRSSRRRTRQPGHKADWMSVNAELLVHAIATVSFTGGALRFGYTRDGGAYAVGVYGDGPEPYTDYIRPGEGVDEYLAELIRDWQEHVSNVLTEHSPGGHGNGRDGSGVS